MAHRYFTQDIAGETARITGPDAAHLARVLRAKPGQAVTLCDGDGTDYEAELVSVAEGEVVARILSQGPTEAEPDIQVHAYIACAKGERMEWAIQKSVELGAYGIHPFFSENCVVKPKKEEEKNKRYSRIALEAAKQSGRGVIPRVYLPVNFKDILADAPLYDDMLFLYEKGGRPLRETVEGQKTLGIITGAEGGFTPAEAQAAGEAGCVTIGLGPRILRCETAPAAVLAAVMTLTGNLE